MVSFFTRRLLNVPAAVYTLHTSKRLRRVLLAPSQKHLANNSLSWSSPFLRSEPWKKPVQPIEMLGMLLYFLSFADLIEIVNKGPFVLLVVVSAVLWLFFFLIFLLFKENKLGVGSVPQVVSRGKRVVVAACWRTVSIFFLLLTLFSSRIGFPFFLSFFFFLA